MDELSFKFVDNKGFKRFMSIVCPQFHVTSKTTITSCLKLYMDEKSRLEKYFAQTG